MIRSWVPAYSRPEEIALFLAGGALVVVMLLGATCTRWSDPQGVQLPLFGDHGCSDPVFDQAAGQCCTEHDIAFAAGGTRQDFHLANAEFLACMLLWDVPPSIAYARWRVVDGPLGWEAWNEQPHRTRGPPR